MAKRRRLEPPTLDELTAMEAGFARGVPAGLLGPTAAPIAQVAAETAALTETFSAVERAATAIRDRDADAWRMAQDKGLVVREIPVGEIIAEELIRDRMVLDPDEMEELKTSITVNGLRMPIEVFKLTNSKAGENWGLLSGYRRLTATRQLFAATGQERYATIRALVREPGSLARAFCAMVEENEIRSDLSHYERGRIAVLAVGQGGFPSIDEAINRLFHSGSKSKRSKVRSFALIHEELGDILNHPTALGERAGLRLANALRTGFGTQIRNALETALALTPEGEWGTIEEWVARAEAIPTTEPRNGRPKKQEHQPQFFGKGDIPLANGVTIRVEHDERGYLIRFKGRQIRADLIDALVMELQNTLGKKL